MEKNQRRGHLALYQWTLNLQSNHLPLSSISRDTSNTIQLSYIHRNLPSISHIVSFFFFFFKIGKKSKISSILNLMENVKEGTPWFRPGTPRPAVECSKTELHPQESSYPAPCVLVDFFWELGEKIKISSTSKFNGKRERRGHPCLNRWPLDQLSNDLPLSCILWNQCQISHILDFLSFFSELEKITYK